MPFVSYAQLSAARDRFRCLAMLERQHLHFDSYTDVTFPDGWHHRSHQFNVSAQTARRVELLLGDNGHAVFKMWVARRALT